MNGLRHLSTGFNAPNLHGNRRGTPLACPRAGDDTCLQYLTIVLLSRSVCAIAYVSSGGDVTGGYGGAIYTGESGVTSISGFRYASHNSAYSGGALYNSGTTIFSSGINELATEFADNAANVRRAHTTCTPW